MVELQISSIQMSTYNIESFTYSLDINRVKKYRKIFCGVESGVGLREMNKLSGKETVKILFLLPFWKGVYFFPFSVDPLFLQESKQEDTKVVFLVNNGGKLIK